MPFCYRRRCHSHHPLCRMRKKTCSAKKILTPGISSGIYSRLSRLLWAKDRFGGTGVISIKRPLRLARPRTPPFHGGDTGSNPVGDANHMSGTVRLDIKGPEKSGLFCFCLSSTVRLDMMESSYFKGVSGGVSKNPQNGHPQKGGCHA